MNAEQAIANAVRLLEAAETDKSLAIDWGAFAGLADSWISLAQLLNEREKAE